MWKKAMGWAIVMLLVGIAGGFLIRLLWPRRRRSITSALPTSRT